MGLRAWLYRQLSRGTAPERDDDALVYLATAPLFRAGLLVETLRANGIDATYSETANPVTRSMTDGKIYVRHGQLAEAEAFFDTLDRRPGDPR